MTLDQVKDKIEVKGMLAAQAVSGFFSKPVTDYPGEVRVVEPPLACRVSEAVNIVVARNGADHIYTPQVHSNGYNCRYVFEGKADCFVGQVLHQIGVPLSALAAVEGKPAQVALARLAYRDQIPGNPSPDEVAEVGGALMLAQVVNDKFGPWGHAARAYRQGISTPC